MFLLPKGHHLTYSKGRENIINQLLEVENFILGLILHPHITICKILILSSFGSIHCVSNGFLNQLLHVVYHLIFQIISKTFWFDAIYIIAHTPIYDGIVDIL